MCTRNQHGTMSEKQRDKRDGENNREAAIKHGGDKSAKMSVNGSDCGAPGSFLTVLLVCFEKPCEAFSPEQSKRAALWLRWLCVSLSPAVLEWMRPKKIERCTKIAAEKNKTIKMN